MTYNPNVNCGNVQGGGNMQDTLLGRDSLVVMPVGYCSRAISLN